MNDEVRNLYLIPSFKIDAMQKKLTRLNRRAAKLDCEPVVVEPTGVVEVVENWLETQAAFDKRNRGYIGERRRRQTIDGLLQNGTPIVKSDYTMRWSYELVEYRVVVSHEVKLEGWELLARIEHAGERNFVFVVPGKQAPDRAYTADRSCDHCKHNRQRKDTYLVEDKRTGEVKQIGSTCLRDFLGHQSPERILGVAEWITNIGRTFDMFSNEDVGDDNPDLGNEGCCVRDYAKIGSEALLAHVAALVRSIGWTSSKAAYEFGKTSTKSEALTWMFTRDRKQVELYADKTGGVQDRDRDLAKAAVAWAHDLDPKGDYEQNLKSAAVNESVTFRAAGILASLIVAYNRHQERETKRRELGKGWKAGHVGTVGKREVFTGLTVVGSRLLESDFGSKILFQFKDPDGHQLAWFCTGRTELEIGEVVDLKATVKQHGAFRGTDQTVISRGTVVK
jgi:hypothetical protein